MFTAFFYGLAIVTSPIWFVAAMVIVVGLVSSAFTCVFYYGFNVKKYLQIEWGYLRDDNFYKRPGTVNHNPPPVYPTMAKVKMTPAFTVIQGGSDETVKQETT